MKLLLDLNLQFFAEPTMNGRDAVNGASGRAFVTIGGQRLLFAQLINLQADMAKTKTTVPIMGKLAKGNKATGAEYTGNATFHYNTSVFRQMLARYAETGEDTYFDIQVTNEDKTTQIGSQTVILRDCNIDGGIIALLDADSDYLEDSFDFTFEDWSLVTPFTELDIVQA